MKGNLLILDDDRPFAERASAFAREVGFDVHPALTLEDALAAAGSQRFDCALIDIGLPDGCGLDLLSDTRLAGTSKIVMSGDSALAAWASRQIPGTLGVLTKPFRFAAFRELLARQEAHGTLPGAIVAPRLLGDSPIIQAVVHELRAVAPTRFPVLIHGGSGTGKELAARMVHEHSRREGRLITVNCAALAPDLLASQMFGHRRGSFTGAVDTHTGLVEQAEGGTLFLDEIAEAPPGMQAALLRFLESGEITPLGSRGPRRANVRVIAATNIEPRAAVADGKLRADLYFRIAGYEVRMPELRERPEDIEIIAQAMLDVLNAEYGTARGFAHNAFDALRGYRWAGNVRELRQVVQRAWLRGTERLVLQRPATTATAALPLTLEEIEREAILEALAESGNDRAMAARRLGISTKTIYNKLARYRDQSHAEGASR
ncbi:sigma-54-dependent transcriptional regulator [Luteibacter sp. 9135]|uniref:sigma-54-dependent transcriptional regulator n=1 Tax=Luteibacter sp. 9135 TaxID=1500893 RepID=UPI0006912393|nr:sigma 54-interacting transcriptional regulator [Luteibacter sp. 9135]